MSNASRFVTLLVGAAAFAFFLQSLFPGQIDTSVSIARLDRAGPDRPTPDHAGLAAPYRVPPRTPDVVLPPGKIGPANPRHVGIVGAAGYIGSALHRHLRSTNYWRVSGYDRNARAAKFPVTRMAGKDIPLEEVRRFGAVVWLGGFTGRKICDSNGAAKVYQENVQDVIDFASKMSPQQLLIFASTSAVMEGSAGNASLETDPVREDLLDSYSLSMYRREQKLREWAESPGYNGPTLIGLRFGTVVGVSPSQRTEFVHVAMVRSALLQGRITVRHPETWRAVLWIRDQVRAIESVLLKWRLVEKRFNVYHLRSFNSRVGQAANEVAAATQVHTTWHSHAVEQDVAGFSLDGGKLQAEFGFEPEGTPRKVVDDLLAHAHNVTLGRDLLDIKQDFVPCRVCGSHDMMVALDLGSQPLANDFRPTAESAERCERFPLKLMRCRKCNHGQLSVMVDRKALFANYSYRSGTSKTLNEYFGWLAKKVSDEVRAEHGGKKKVLELACNDGTQLNHFRDMGWETYGVDPATNLVPLARANGHKVVNELWGASQDASKYAELPAEFDAIVGQNVLAHVPNPVDFVAACAQRMGKHTRLYLQTSQCEMFHDGQFDTAYHEHISFFGPRSFRELARSVGLVVVRWEITPIHGGSCLVTMMKGPASEDGTLDAALALEVSRGQLEDSYYLKYRERALGTRSWLNDVLETMNAQGHQIVGYGAAAKGMVLLHFLLATQPKVQFDYVVDDAPLKQNTYCPGTSIPVRPASELSKYNGAKPLTIVVFTWNFWAEIRTRIADALMKAPVRPSAVRVVLPFPKQEILVMHGSSLELLRSEVERPYTMPVWDYPRKRIVGLVTHFYNEEMLMPYFIQHHAPMFDEVIALDSNSNDGTTKVLKEYAPSTWRVIKSSVPQFSAQLLDDEVSWYENTMSDMWRVALTTTEFVVHPDLREELAGATRAQQSVLRFPALLLVGNDDVPLRRFEAILSQRSEFLLRSPRVNDYGRFLNRLSPNYYGTGRHVFRVPGIDVTPHIMARGYVTKLFFTPWPESLPRKLQIRGRIPPQDLQAGLGVQHDVTTAEQLNARRAELRRSAGVADLRDRYALGADESLRPFQWAWYQTTHGRLRFHIDDLRPT